MLRKITLGAAAAVAAVTALPATAYAHGSYDGGYSSRSYDDGYYRGRSHRDYRGKRCSGTTGTILGAAAGALLGRQIDKHGNRTTGTVVGGAAGAVIGRELGKSTCRR